MRNSIHTIAAPISDSKRECPGLKITQLVFYGKENGSYYNIFGLYREYLGSIGIMERKWKLLFRVWGLGFRV